MANKTKKWTVEEIVYLQSLMQPECSLNQPISEGENSDDPVEFGDFLPSDEPGPQEVVEERDRRKELIELMHRCLSPREEMVLRLRFGIDDKNAKTLDQIGVIFHVTRERIRQIESTAIRKLRKRFSDLGITREDI